jgi:hypothetical protein
LTEATNKKEASARKARANESRGQSAIYVAAAMALVLTATIVERVARLHDPQAGDWIMTAAAVAVTSILVTLVITARSTEQSSGAPGEPGHAEAVVFDLDMKTSDGLTGNLALSIREAANEVARITDQLAAAHEGSTGTNQNTESAIKTLIDSQGEALTRIDATGKAAALVGEESARAGESLAAIVELATAHAGHGKDHARALETIAGLATKVLRKTSDAVVHARILERDRDALALNAQEYLSALHQMRGIVDGALVAFRDSAKTLDEPVSPGAGGMDTATADSGSGADESIPDITSATRELSGRLGKVSECIQLARMNQRLHQNAPASPSSLRAIETSLDEAEAVLREVRDAAAMIEITLGRSSEKQARVISQLRAGMEGANRVARQMDQRGRILSRIAGEMAQSVGQLRLTVQTESARMEQILSRPLSSHAAGELQPILQELLEKAAEVAQGTNRMAIDGQRQNMDSIRIKAICQDLRSSSDVSREQVTRLQQASGSAALKLESMVNLVQSVLGREDGVTRRSAASTARLAIRDKVSMIDQFASRLLEIEDKSKRLSGPSPALERSEMDHLPEYNVPVQ